MPFNIGVVKAGLSGLAGRVIQSGKNRATTSRAAINFMHAPPAWFGRYVGAGAANAGLAGPAAQKAMRGMVRNQTMKGMAQGAAIGAGIAGGRQMFRNAYDGDRPLMSGVGGAAFRGGLWGSQIGGLVAPARAVLGANSKAWAGLAAGGHLGEVSAGALGMQRIMHETGTMMSMQRMENTLLRGASTARRAAAQAAKG